MAVSPEEDTIRRDLLQHLAEAIDRLPAQERKVLTLLVYKGLGQKEIAEVLGVTPSRVSQIHSRAIIRLRAALSAAVIETAQP